MPEIKLPENSEPARSAADKAGSPCAVVVTVNREADTFDIWTYGANDVWRYMAGEVAKIAGDALDGSEPPADWRDAATLIVSKPAPSSSKTES